MNKKNFTIEQEAEVNERVNLIMETFLQGLENSIGFHRGLSYSAALGGDWRACKEQEERIKFRGEVLSMLRKEIKMPLPIHDNSLYFHKRREIVDKSIENFLDICVKLGDRDYHHKQTRVVKNIYDLIYKIEDLGAKQFKLD